MLVVLKVQQFYIQYKMTIALESSKASFEKLIINAGEFSKCKINSKEIIYKGKLYDIKSVLTYGDKVEMIVVNDIYEENLLVKIKNLLSNSDQNKKGNPVELQKLILLQYISPEIKDENLIPYLSINTRNKVIINIYIFYPDIISPPPESV